jgi:tRNA 2-thiouridine synthesizing protein A
MPHEVTHRADVTLDLTGLTCPGPILGAKKIIDELRQGQVLLLISDCPATHDDLHAWAARTGNQVVHSERRADGATGYFVQRGRHAQPAPHVVLDLRGFVCPGPIVEARRVLQRMSAGETLKLLSDCPGALDDIKDWARVTDALLVDVVETGAHEWEFYVRKP